MEIQQTVNGEIIVLTVVGKLDSVTSTDLQDRVLQLIDSGAVKLVINFEKLSYISSAGLRVLLMGQKRVKPQGGSLVLSAVSDQIKEIFNVSGFTQLFQFADNWEAGLSKF